MQEYTEQRRVKPLPKRRRTSDLDSAELTAAAVYVDAAASVGVDPAGAGAPQSTSLSVHPDFASYYQFTSSLGLGSPPLNDPHNVRIDGGPGSLADPHGMTSHQQLQQQQRQGELLSSIAAYRNHLSGGRADEDDEHADGDYVDHLQQPGNTKKRKVPAATHGMLGGGGTNFDDSLASFSGADGIARQADEFPGGHLGGGIGVPVRVSLEGGLAASAVTHPRKIRYSAATMTGLKRKDMLKSRKRQVLAIVNSLPNTETLALDQALASHIGWYRSTSGIHFRRRPANRSSRKTTASSSSSSHHQHQIPQSTTASTSDEAVASIFGQQLFTFEWPSTTTERLIATRTQVSILIEKFQKELARQAAAVAQAARLAAAANSEALIKASSAKSQRTRPSESAKSANNANPRATGGGTGSSPPTSNGNESVPNPVPPKGKSKKKKRSALANASNPHHLRNYVPSRLPNGGIPSTISAAQAALQFLGPAPVRFLGADLGGQRGVGATAASRKRMSDTAPDEGVQLPDEWICAFCEYDLFYGTEASYRHSIRARKKILRRRRRARERAARAASGVGPATAPGPTTTTDDGEMEDEAEYEADSPYEAVAQSSASRITPGGSQHMTAGRTGGDDGAG